jgi:hypothetical protein
MLACRVHNEPGCSITFLADLTQWTSTAIVTCNLLLVAPYGGSFFCSFTSAAPEDLEVEI